MPGQSSASGGQPLGPRTTTTRGKTPRGVCAVTTARGTLRSSAHRHRVPATATYSVWAAVTARAFGTPETKCTTPFVGVVSRVPRTSSRTHGGAAPGGSGDGGRSAQRGRLHVIEKVRRRTVDRP